MFEREDVVLFINKIINGDTANRDVIKRNIRQFSEYLQLTKMTTDESLKDLEQLMDCLDEILSLKEKMGVCDITTMFALKDENKDTIKVLEKVKEEPTYKVLKEDSYREKHYNHYYSSPRYTSSSSCSGGGGVRSSC